MIKILFVVDYIDFNFITIKSLSIVTIGISPIHIKKSIFKQTNTVIWGMFYLVKMIEEKW